ncbi:hypothetical protein SDC9_148569 [bioreactor metagenome]|uniref:Uncharacterized protein n=1 Tax=bioreactor metagenome TaxID=1076179 RepID=A0A645EJ53_9ZZZZ
MDIGDNGCRRVFDDLCQSLRIFLIENRQSDNFAFAFTKLVDLMQSRRGISCFGIAHGLNHDRVLPSDLDTSDCYCSCHLSV